MAGCTRDLFSSDQQRDVIKESVIQFLDPSFSPEDVVIVANTEHVHHQYRISPPSDLNIQNKKDIDIITIEDVENGKTTCAEVKCSPYNVNSNLDTFAFEIQKRLRPGWLWNICPDTSGYMFLIWIKTIPDTESDKFPSRSGISYDEFPLQSLSAEEIMYLTCQLIRKEAIIEYLKTLGCDKKQLIEKARYMVKNDIESMELNENGVYLYHNTGLCDKPVNVVIPATILKRLMNNDGRYYIFHYKKNTANNNKCQN